MPKPTKHGMYVHEKDECLWIPGMVQTQKQDITVPGGLLLMEGQTPPTSPTTTHHFEATCNQVRKQWLAREKQEKLSYHLKLWDLHTEPVHLGMWFPDIPGLAENNDLDSLVVDYLHYVTTQLQQATPTAGIRYVKGFIASRDAIQTETAETMRQRVIREFSTTFFLGKTSGNPPKRGVLDEAEIIPKPVAIPVKKRPFQMVGERRAAWVNLSNQTLGGGKTEPGQRPWSSPNFPVPKKRLGLVVDFSKINDATVVHAQPLPRIGDILQRKGKFRIWSVLDMNHGYHQIPNKEEHRNITCMSTPRRSMRWKVLVKGLKNGNAIFK